MVEEVMLSTAREERVLIQWSSDSPSMVEIEAVCALLQRDLSDKRLLVTLCIEGERLPKFSELNKLLHVLEPLVQRIDTLHIFCSHRETKKLLEFCGFPFVAEFIEKKPSI